MVDSNSHPNPREEFSAFNRPNVISREGIVAEQAREFNTVGVESHFAEGPARRDNTNAHSTTLFSGLVVFHGHVSFRHLPPSSLHPQTDAAIRSAPPGVDPRRGWWRMMAA